MSDNKEISKQQQQPDKKEGAKSEKTVVDELENNASNSVSEEQPATGLAALVGDDL